MHVLLRSSFAAAALAAAFAAPVAAQTTTWPALVYGTVPVGGAPFDLLLDLVVPSGAGPWPVVVWVHGGGWIGGSRLPIPGSVTRLLPLGYAVASIDYRLSGQAIWPAQLQDCKAAIRFLRANAASYGLDPDRIAAMGSSAGGHLVAALGTAGDVGEVHAGSYTVDLEGTVGPHTGTSSRVQCVLDLFGPTDMLWANDFPTFDHDSPTAPEGLLIGGAIQQHPERWATVDPISFVTPDDALLLILHGTDDTTVPFHNGERLFLAAQAIGHDVAFLPVQDAGHGGPGFSTPAVNAVTDAFLARALRDLPDVVVGVATSDPIAAEGGDPATFVVTRTGSTAQPLDVALWLGGDVEPGADCERLPLVATIAAGQASTTLVLTPLEDALVEGDEAAVLHVVPSDRYRVDHAASSAVATLHDDEVAAGLPLVSLQELDAAATEAPGNPGAVRVVRTGPTALPLEVSYTIAGTATNGADCVALTGVATIPAGSVALPIVVLPLQDTQRESGETVVLRLAAAAGYSLGASRSAHVVIADDDRTSPLPTVAVIGTDRTAGEPGEHGAFTVTRTGSTAAPLVVQVAVGGTASPGMDHAAIGGTVTIPAGAAFRRVPVTVLDDFAVEGAEDVTLTILPSPGYVRSAIASQQLWIGDDEAPPQPPAAVGFAVGPLAVGRTGAATVTGGAPGGIAVLWIALAPGWLPLAPFGTVQIDPAQAGSFVAGGLDGDGAVTLPIAIPATPSLAGFESWWQALATTAAAPFLVLSDAARRVVSGPPPF